MNTYYVKLEPKQVGKKFEYNLKISESTIIDLFLTSIKKDVDTWIKLFVKGNLLVKMRMYLENNKSQHFDFSSPIIRKSIYNHYQFSDCDFKLVLLDNLIVTALCVPNKVILNLSIFLNKRLSDYMRLEIIEGLPWTKNKNSYDLFEYVKLYK
jgi:hypothetical protein